MNLEQEKQRVAQKYKLGTWRYYLHLWASIIKSTYHQDKSMVSNIDKNNYVPYLPAGCTVDIFGKGNTVEIDPSVTVFVAGIIIGDPQTPVEGCIVKIGKNSSCGGANIRLYENNSAVYIGDDCMFSFGIEIWASDSHSIIDYTTKKLVNWGKTIFIGNHVWVGMRATILKNTYINNDCIVGAGAVVAGRFERTHCVLAGNPARVIKEKISWDSLRPIQYQKKCLCSGSSLPLNTQNQESQCKTKK